jgi:FkbM family methyltransferase
MFFGLDETAVVRLALRVLRPGDTVYDVGAHLGYMCIAFASSVGDTGRIHAFELLPTTAAGLRKTLELNRFDNCTVHSIGLSDSERRWRIAVNPQLMGSSEFCRGPDFRGPAEVCRIHTLDGYRRLDPIPVPTLMKVDVEGAEVGMLRGARETIESCAPLMIVEFHSLALLREGLEWLQHAGYSAASIPGGHPLAGTTLPARGYPQHVLCYQADRRSHRERLGA